MFAVPAVKVTTALPAPVTGPVKAYVPLLPKVNVAPLATENDPTAVLILERDSVPAFTATVPPVLLLKGTETVLVAVPPVFSKVPELLNAPFGVVSCAMPASIVKFQTAPVRLLI